MKFMAEVSIGTFQKTVGMLRNHLDVNQAFVLTSE